MKTSVTTSFNPPTAVLRDVQLGDYFVFTTDETLEPDMPNGVFCRIYAQECRHYVLISNPKRTWTQRSDFDCMLYPVRILQPGDSFTVTILE